MCCNITFYIFKKLLYNTLPGPADGRAPWCEESPGSTEQGCLITSGVGNYRESATENTPPKQLGCGKVEMAR